MPCQVEDLPTLILDERDEIDLGVQLLRTDEIGSKSSRSALP